MPDITLGSTVQELLDHFCLIDEEHSTEEPTLTDFGQNGFQVNWENGSKVRVGFATMSMTPDGVRSRPTVDLTDLPGGYNPNNPSPPEMQPVGPLEGDVIPVEIPYRGPPRKNTLLEGDR